MQKTNKPVERSYHLSVGGMGYCGIVHMSDSEVIAQGYVKKHTGNTGIVKYAKPYKNAYGLMLGFASIQLIKE